MAPRWVTVVADRAESSFGDAVRFWAGATAAAPTPLPGEQGGSSGAVVLVPPDGDAYFALRPVPPAAVGPDGRAGCALVLHVDDVGAGVEAALAAGAAPDDHGGPGRDMPGGDGVALLSPAGLSLLVARHRGAPRRPGPAPVPDAARRTLVDQVCVDIPPGAHDAERAFWATVTGWPRRPGTRSEYTYLMRPPGLPLRVLLQRLEGPDDRERVGAHLDLSCDDVPAAVAHHRRLGARVVAEFPAWVTMADPTGAPYCLTRRLPDRP